jgi:hypothetical protein
MRGGPNRGALAALGLAGLVWAYKNRDMISSKLNEFRGQMQNKSNSGQFSDRSFQDRPFESQTELPGRTRLGDNYNTNI